MSQSASEEFARFPEQEFEILDETSNEMLTIVNGFSWQSHLPHNLKFLSQSSDAQTKKSGTANRIPKAEFFS